MVKAEDSWLFQQHPAYHLPNLNGMSALLQHGQQNGLPYSMNHCTVLADVTFPGFNVPGVCGLGTGQTNRAHGLFQCLPPHLESLPSTINPYVREQSAFFYGHEVKVMPNAVSGATQKRFVIFDQSGNDARLPFSPICSPFQNLIVAPTESLNAWDFPTKPTIQEEIHENEIIGAGSEMHEDTEEINALLYSDDDDSGDSEEDEVTSTGHSPFAIDESYKKRKLMEEITTEVVSSNSPMKRQKLLNGGYKKSSLMNNMVSSTKYDDDAESSCAKDRTQGEDLDSMLGYKQSRKDKIRQTLKILESLIPGVKSNDPSVVIEEAISYLKYLRLHAKALGVS